MRRLQGDPGVSYMFLFHDLAVVRAMADTILEFGRAFQAETPKDKVSELHRKERSSAGRRSA